MHYLNTSKFRFIIIIGKKNGHDVHNCQGICGTVNRALKRKAGKQTRFKFRKLM